MHAKSKISDMLPRSFKAAKCKTSLKLAVARIKLLKNKREVSLKQMRRDLAQLLESGQEQTARIRVEHVIREEKIMSAYDLIEIYCELIVARLPIIESQKSCPIDLKEAIASIVFASLRCADIPELMEIRKHFLAKYGKEFITAALEVRPECGVSRMVVEKLSARAPDVETKIKTLTAIAQEHNCKWDPKAFQEQIQKPNDDLLNGPTTFTGAYKMTMEFPSINPGQKNESIRNMSDNVVTSKSDNFKTMPHENTNTSSTSVSVTNQSSPRTSENRSGGEEFKFSYSKKGSALSPSNWHMEFKDATSAAQAAAESAEMASMAARAAAELASQGSISRQNSSGSQKSIVHGIRDVPGMVKCSRLEDKNPVMESVTMEESERKSFQGMKPEIHKPQVVQANTMRDADYVYDGHGTVGNISSSRSLSHSSTSSIIDDVSEVDLQKVDTESYSYTPKTFSNAEYAVQHQKSEKVKHADVGSGNVKESKSTSFHHTNASDGDTIWDNPDNTSICDSNAAVFDDYGSDTDDYSVLVSNNRENLLDSFMPQQSMEPWSPEQQKCESLVTSARSPFVTEPRPTEYSETITKCTLPTQSNDDMPPAYDSDGLSSMGDDEKDRSTCTEVMQPSNLLHFQRGSTQGLPSAGSNNETTYFNGKKDVEGAKIDSLLSFPGFNEKSHEEELSCNKYWKSSGFSERRNHPSPRYERNLDSDSSVNQGETKDKFGMASSHSGIKDSELSDESHKSGQELNSGRLTGGFKNRGYHRPPYVRSPLVDASLPSKQASDASLPSKHASDDSPSATKKPVVSNVDDSSASTEVPVLTRYRKDYKESSLRFPITDFNPNIKEQEHHIVGNRHLRDSSSTPPEQAPDVSPIIEESTVSHPSKLLLTSNVPKQEMYDHNVLMKAYTESSTSVPMNYLDNNEEEDSESCHSVARRGKADAKPSRWTRYIPSESQRGSLSRTIDRPELTAISNIEYKGSQSSSYAAESFSNTRIHAGNLVGKESSRSLQPNSSAQQSSVTPLRTESSTVQGSPKTSHRDSVQSVIPENDANLKIPSSSREKTSHGSSHKNASHVHPKLPDYESIMAHFQSLRSNRA
ncbi:uncharacterized protein [Elaeis guineensis]|uniref:Uncharacterized protein LOC105047619 n=1 Tax=Elaeis guineensis var. tenera TaxID=51953 RepID=A0A6I9RDQ9_ELAGV|nr:uncharacterized protein LOC105047619 [Elaeis guineensis]